MPLPPDTRPPCENRTTPLNALSRISETYAMPLPVLPTLPHAAPHARIARAQLR